MSVPTCDPVSSFSSAVGSGKSETTSCMVDRAQGSSLQRYVPLVVLSAAAGLDAGGVSILNSALPSMRTQFGISAQNLSWAVSGYALAFAGLLLCGGALADRLRRRRVLVWGLAVITAGAMLAFIAPVFWVVVIGRMLQGVGAAITMPAATALLTSVYPNDPMRSRALGVFSSATGGCYAAGLVLGGVITTALGWRWVFALQVLVAVFTAVAAMRWLPVSARQRYRPIDRVGAGALVTAITLIILAADLASQHHGIPLAAVLLAAAAGMGYLWWRRSRVDNKEVLLDRAVLRLGSVRIAAAVACVFFFCVAGSLFFLPLYLQQMRGMSAAVSGLAILPVSLAMAISALLTGRLMKTRGPRTLLTLGILLTALGILLWCTADAHSPYLGTIFAGLVITGIGHGLTFPALIAIGLQDVPAAAHGMASALTTTALQIGSAIGPTVLAGIAQSVAATTGDGLSLTGYRLAFAAAAAVLVLIAGPAVVRLPKQPAV
ncbi:MAG: MFS transporter [Mycobacteriaceae bacterium]|nr:MFS transporter [Mycobacteriaceae bacterium]